MWGQEGACPLICLWGRSLCSRIFAPWVTTTTEEKKVMVESPSYFYPYIYINIYINIYTRICICMYIYTYIRTCLLVTLGDLEWVAWSFIAPTISITYLFHSLAIGFRRLIFGNFFFFVTFKYITKLVTINSNAVKFYALRKMFS